MNFNLSSVDCLSCSTIVADVPVDIKVHSKGASVVEEAFKGEWSGSHGNFIGDILVVFSSILLPLSIVVRDTSFLIMIGASSSLL